MLFLTTRTTVPFYIIFMFSQKQLNHFEDSGNTHTFASLFVQLLHMHIQILDVHAGYASRKQPNKLQTKLLSL